jgi:hypothetical protein
MTEKIALKEKILAVDLGAKNLWDDIDEDQRKALKNELWILNRYISNAKTSNREHAEHFVLTVNEYFNKHWFTLQKHPKLMWQLLCLCNWDGKKTFYHEWLALGKKTKNSKRVKLLEDVYPNIKQDELELLAEISTNDELKELATELGWTDKEIKDL